MVRPNKIDCWFPLTQPGHIFTAGSHNIFKELKKKYTKNYGGWYFHTGNIIFFYFISRAAIIYMWKGRISFSSSCLCIPPLSGAPTNRQQKKRKKIPACLVFNFFYVRGNQQSIFFGLNKLFLFFLYLTICVWVDFFHSIYEELWLLHANCY